MKFKEFILKHSKLFIVVLSAVSLFIALSGLGFYLWFNYHTMAKVGDFVINRAVVRENIPKYKEYVLSVKGEDASMEKEVYTALLQEKAVEYEAKKRNLSVTDNELKAEIESLGQAEGSQGYYASVLAGYGWSKETADSKVRTRMLQEKLESVVITSFDVNHFYTRTNTKPLEGETKEQIETKALALINDARTDAMAGKSLADIKKEIADSSKTWNGDMTHGWGNVNGVNEFNETDKLANGKYWPAIKGLQNVGDTTAVIDATTQGDLYVFWQLTRKNTGSFDSMEDFYDSFEPASKVLQLMQKITPAAYAACNDWLNDNVNTADELAYYRISKFVVYVRDASTHAVITNHPIARVVTKNVEPADGHCDATWCNMSQNDALGTNGQATMLNSCCQFTYSVEITGLTGHVYVHTYQTGVEGGSDTDYSMPTKFNGDNGIDLMRGYFDFNPQTFAITPSTDTGCTISPATTQTVNHGATSAAFNGSANTGFTFLGFSIDGSSTLVATNPYNFTNVTRAHTIQARCNPAGQVTLNYDANGATGGTAPASVTTSQNSTLTVSANVGNLQRTNYSPFSVWNTQSDGSGTDYAAGASITMGSNIVLYAKWNALPAISCSVTPPSGITPLVVEVEVSPTGGAAGPYDYNMGDGTPIVTNKPENFWYTYSTSGTYVVQARTANLAVGWTPCGAVNPNGTTTEAVTVTDPSDSSGGEVRP